MPAQRHVEASIGEVLVGSIGVREIVMLHLDVQVSSRWLFEPAKQMVNSLGGRIKGIPEISASCT